MKRPIRPIHGKDRNNYERVFDRTHDILNGGISLGDFGPNGVNNGFVNGSRTKTGNLDAAIVQVAAGIAGNTFATTHSLGRIPVGFIVINRNNNGNIFQDTGTPATNTTMNFKCDVTGTQFTLMIF